MKLSEVVAYIKQLDELPSDEPVNHIMRYMSAVEHVITTHHIKSQDLDTQIVEKLKNVKEAITQFDQIRLQILWNLRHVISTNEPNIFRECNERYVNEVLKETDKIIFDRRLNLASEDHEYLMTRISLYSDWRWPGMIIRPNTGDFMNSLVALDPLYLVDWRLELMQPTLDIYKDNETYLRRLRKYTIDPIDVNPIYQQLPNNQFGFILAYNYFNYVSMDALVRNLSELFDKLRPGGGLIFTYNNCDQKQGMALYEKCFMMYTPKRLMTQHLNAIGFEIIEAFDGQGDVSWFELRKPGQLTSIRGGQALARIIAND